MPFVLDANADLPRRLGEALSQVRNVAVPCEFVIPPPTKQSLDYDKVNVRQRDPRAGGRALRGQRRPLRPRARRLVLRRRSGRRQAHPGGGLRKTCQAFKADENAKVDLVFGCKTIAID